MVFVLLDQGPNSVPAKQLGKAIVTDLSTFIVRVGKNYRLANDPVDFSLLSRQQ